MTCWYWLRARDAAGNVSRCSNLAGLSVPLGLVEPAGPDLAPRRQPARAPVLLDWRGRGAESVRIYDVAGRLLRTFRLSRTSSGTVEWDGRDESGRLVPAGLYFARLSGGSLHTQTRVVLLP